MQKARGLLEKAACVLPPGRGEGRRGHGMGEVKPPEGFFGLAPRLDYFTMPP